MRYCVNPSGEGVIWEQVIDATRTLLTATMKLNVFSNYVRCRWLARKISQVYGIVFSQDLNLQLDCPLVDWVITSKKTEPTLILAGSISQSLLDIEKLQNDTLNFNQFQKQ